MKLSCEIVQDLLPLFADEVCSEQSRQAVTEHLRECEACRKLIENTGIPELELEPEQPTADKAVAKSFRRVRRRWILSLISVLLIIPVALLGFLGVNQAKSRGICFTNLNEIITARGFVRALTSGNYEKAADYLNFDRSYEEVQTWLAMQPEDYAPELVEITIGGEQWMAERSFAESYLQDTSDALSVWSYLAYNGIYGVLIPEESWQEVIQADPSAYQTDNDGSDIFGGIRYLRLETAWGAFMVDEASFEFLYDGDLAYFIGNGSVFLFPEEIYRALESEIQNVAVESYEQIQILYADVIGMSPEEYTEYKRKQYADGLKELVQEGFSIKNKGYQSAYKMDGRWIVVYAVEVSSYAGSKMIYLDVESDGGAVNSVGMHYSGNDGDWIALLGSVILVH